MFKKILLFVIGLYCITSYSFAQNTNPTFISFMQSNYGLKISKNFANTNKYCKINSLSKELKITIQDCDKRIRTFIQESYDILIKPDNVLNINGELRPIYMTLNSYLTNKLSTQSNEGQIKNVRNSITSIIKNQSNLSMSIDWDIAIQIASLNIILNDYIINNKKSTTVTNVNSTNNVQENTITDCNDDYNCFIEKSKTCTPSKFIKDTPLDMFGIIITTKTYYEIKGVKNNKCGLYLNTVKQNLSYSPEIIQTALSKGLTMDAINKDLEEKNKQTKAVEGLDGTCNLSTTYLTKILNEWKEGTMNSNQLTSTFCSGKLFPNNSMTFNLSDKK